MAEEWYGIDLWVKSFIQRIIDINRLFYKIILNKSNYKNIGIISFQSNMPYMICIMWFIAIAGYHEVFKKKNIDKIK